MPTPECDHPNQHVTKSAEYHDQQSCHKKPPFFTGQLYLFSMVPGTCCSLPPSSTKPIMVPTWSKSLVLDSTDVLMPTFKNIIHHPDAAKPDSSNIGNEASAPSTSAPVNQVVRLPTAVAPVTPTPEAIPQTPYKAVPAVCSPQWTQMPSIGTHLSQTGTAPPVLCWSTQSRKSPSRLLEEI